MTIDNFNALERRLAEYAQEHLLKHWDELNDDERHQLCADLEELYLPELKRYFDKATAAIDGNRGDKLDDRIQPIPDSKLVVIASTPPEKLDEYKAEGLVQISEGRVGVLLMAGGQGNFYSVLFCFIFNDT